MSMEENIPSRMAAGRVRPSSLLRAASEVLVAAYSSRSTFCGLPGRQTRFWEARLMASRRRIIDALIVAVSIWVFVSRWVGALFSNEEVKGTAVDHFAAGCDGVYTGCVFARGCPVNDVLGSREGVVSCDAIASVACFVVCVDVAEDRVMADGLSAGGEDF